ncbi:LOW QUALITY PROTEIN: uncharacterized protein [Haliaeetus albicilla]|uniref:LOW QUALITY PROTEIN: uncharacterized protein n=1 Tax=Haliaeetus albicilla TaxID=8969 RepID=UPI0037E9939F
MSDSKIASLGKEVLFDSLEKHKARPSVPGVDWAQGNWYNLQSVIDQMVTLQEDARVRSGKGKAIVCAVLGASLAAAVEDRDCHLTAESQIIESLQNLVQFLLGQVVGLKAQLESEKNQVKHLQIALKEQLLAGTIHEEIPPRSEIGYPFKDLQAAKERVEKLELPSLRPLVKTEYIYDDEQDQFPQVTTKEVTYTATELAKLKKEFGRTPKESETEYVWRVSLSGGDQIMLSEKEAEGYWRPGVFLTTGDYCAPWSLTQRAAYWAGGLNPLERGDPLTIRGTVDQLVESVQKAACLQMMYDQKLEPTQESSMMMSVDPERMTPLIRGLPDSLKPIGIQLQGKIQAMPQGESVGAALGGFMPDQHLQPPDKKMWTWGEVAQELINYGHKYGPVNPPATKMDTRGLRRAEVKIVPHSGSDKRTRLAKTLRGRDIPNKHGSPWSTVCTAPWSGPELSKLQAKFSCKPGETETEYLWRVSLTGEDRILLSDDEARNYWGPGVFLSAGSAGDQSITSRVAYWAGGADPRERGEPVTIQVKGLSELTEGVQKPTCVQAMYDRGQQGIPMTALVDPRHLRPFIRDLLDVLKIHVQSLTLRERILGVIECNQQNPQKLPTHVTTWEESADDIRKLVKLLEGKARDQREVPAFSQEEKRDPFAALREELEGLKN